MSVPLAHSINNNYGVGQFKRFVGTLSQQHKVLFHMFCNVYTSQFKSSNWQILRPSNIGGLTLHRQGLWLCKAYVMIVCTDLAYC